MFVIDGKAVTMNKGDFGIVYNVHFTDIADNYTFVFKIKNMNDEVIFEKEYGNIQDNTIHISLDKEETILLNKGNYSWGLVQMREGELYNTLINDEMWKVEGGC